MSEQALSMCQSPIPGGTSSNILTVLLQTLIASQCALNSPSAWPEDHGTTNLLPRYDFVIIGASSSGAVLTSRLSENRNWNVLLVEAGEDPPLESEIPALHQNVQRGPHTYGYETEPNPNACLGTRNGRCYWPIAKTMGGVSSIDSLISFRGNKAKFDEWNIPGWNWKEVSKYYDLAERYLSPSSALSGRLITNDFTQYDNCHILDMILSGGEELGLPRLVNADTNIRPGYGYIRGTLENGQRMGAGKTYLSVVKSRPNVHVLKGAVVKKLNFTEDKSIKSVQLVYNENDDGEQEIEVEVTKEVILSAGALGSPKLLMLSGIGPQEELNARSIPVVSDLPGVGKNLQDQLGLPVPFQVNKAKSKPKTSKESQIDTFYYLMYKYGPLSTIGSLALVGYLNSDPGCRDRSCRSPNLNIYHLFLQRNAGSLQMWYDSVGLSNEISQSLEDVNKDAHLLLSFLALQSPKSQGRIELAANLDDNVKVFANYLGDAADIETLLQGIRYQMRLEQTYAYKKSRAKIIKLDIPECDQFIFKSDEYWRCYIKYMGTTMATPSGTTKMGIDTDPDAVVDPSLKVRGVKGLRVIGNSVYPTPIASSTPEVMFGEKLAAIMKKDWL